MGKALGTAWVLAGVLNGCSVGPDYTRPAQATPSGWGEGEAARISAAQVDLARWWTIFADPGLESVIDRALHSNFDLRLAAVRIREARAQYGIVAGAILPEVDASGAVTRSRISQNSIIGQRGFPIYSSSYNAGFDASWELDIFGGTRRSIEAAGADIDASIEERREVLVSLLGEVARNYVELRGRQRLIAVLESNVNAALETLALTRSRLSGGLATTLDVARAETQLGSVRSQIPPVAAAQKQAVHHLGILLGQEPSALAAELEKASPIPVPPAQVIVGLPSDLVFRRPDLRRGERELAAATARVGVATADFYPKFSLTGSFGLESVSSAEFFTWASRAWSVGPSVRWPIFQGGRIRANVDLQDAKQEEAAISLEKALLVAMGEVEDAMVAYLREWDRHKALEDSVLAADRAARLSDDLYRKGLVNFLDVLEAQRTLFIMQGSLAESDAQVSLNLV
ncbi:MAG TPA: efflux transporter outer membrane subunit, partial [Planctomycetota bacterium]|nr:efflux transporter outer membrane subunit [Planctomycetota bacterium]